MRRSWTQWNAAFMRQGQKNFVLRTNIAPTKAFLLAKRHRLRIIADSNITTTDLHQIRQCTVNSLLHPLAGQNA